MRASKRTLTSTDLIQTTTLPERLTIVGGGYQGIEFASIALVRDRMKGTGDALAVLLHQR